LAYYVKGVEKLALLSPTRVNIVSREKKIEDDIMLFLVANSHSVGGFDKLAPRADLADGYFDVLVIKKTSLPEFIRLATLALRGDHIQDPRVIYFQTSELKVTSEREVQLNLDGELGGALPCHFKVLHKHMHMMMPK
jgi:diacylglycerol kinase (ATP)